ncbi:MAG: hypothetical protein IKB00_04915 [Bacteroidaceae bacterium]|nr:hypothetical protein [Bacteroidaceae bacterium]MBR6856630.1 hypothetical protein [Bacteroidaceae bacterium]
MWPLLLFISDIQHGQRHFTTSTLSGITLMTPGPDNKIVFVVYDKKKGETVRYYLSELMDPEQKFEYVPSFMYCYKGKAIVTYTYDIIRQSEEMMKFFPTITEESNPVLIFTNL